MNRSALILMLLLPVTGCVSLPPLAMSDLNAEDGSYVVDSTGKDRYPPFGAAEGNIYSCRAGIRHIGFERFVPPKAATFGALMVKARPEVASRRVVLEQFDVYQNYRLRSLSGTRAMGGAVFAAVAGAADKKNNKASDLENFSIRENPGEGRWKTGENQVGCDGRGEGEYYASEANGGHDVIVTWLKFTVDGTPYHFRSAYQYQFDESTSKTADDKVRVAIELTIASVASALRL